MSLKYFTFNVPAGEEVSSIVVDPGLGGVMTANVWLFSSNASSPASCGEYAVTASTELLGAPNSAPSLASGDHTIGLNVLTHRCPVRSRRKTPSHPLNASWFQSDLG